MKDDIQIEIMQRSKGERILVSCTAISGCVIILAEKYLYLAMFHNE